MKNGQRAKKDKATAKAFVLLLIKIAAVAFAVTVIFSFVIGAARINDIGMMPAVAPGDLIIYYRLDKNYVASDVIVFDYKGEKRTARVVAVSGDKVEIKDNELIINGSRQYEPKVYDDTLAVEKGVSFPVTVEPDHVFVMGDNRKKAADSRLFGSVPVGDTYGKVFAVIRRQDI